jgi:hypothetical protein
MPVRRRPEPCSLIAGFFPLSFAFTLEILGNNESVEQGRKGPVAEGLHLFSIPYLFHEIMRT